MSMYWIVYAPLPMNVISLNFESQKLTYYNMTMALYVFLVTGDTRRRRQRQPGFYRTAV